MATSWKSQQGGREYSLQFETDEKEKYIFIEKAARMAVDGDMALVVEVVRCPECIYCENMKCKELRDDTGHPLDVAVFDYCSQGVRKERRDN